MPAALSKRQVMFAFLGLLLVSLGLIYARKAVNVSPSKVEVLEATTEGQGIAGELIAEIAGAVQKPGVYRLFSGARIEDLIILAGGFSAAADRVWIEKTLNRAAKISDGQKIYVPEIGEQTGGASAKNTGDIKVYQSSGGNQGSGLVSINTASLSELDSLPGIGPVYGQNIIEHRPYSTREELVSKGALKQSVYEKIKDSITVY